MYMEAYLDSKKKENIETTALDVLFFFKKKQKDRQQANIICLQLKNRLFYR